MNVQDAKNLTIPEGSVKMMHDKDNRLLWGAVGYDAKYSGDTTQETTTGKNLVDFANISYSSANSGTATRDGATYTVTATSQSFSGIQFVQNNLHLQPDTTYTFSAKVVSTTATNGSSVYVMSAMSSTDSNIAGNLAKAGEISKVTFTTPSSISNTASIRLYGRTAGAIAVFTDIQLEKGPSATNWEKYTGGIPAPNPDYPQTVNVVTGVQTVSVSDGGGNTQTFTIDLGPTELCKIGTYQDYIYKSGDDWYVHKELSKVTFNGTESWEYYGSSNYRFRKVITDAGALAESQNDIPSVLVNYYMPFVWNYTPRPDYGATSGADNKIAFRNVDITLLDDWKTWLSSHNTTVYYPLATPTDTKITDATLIIQLNAIHEWLARYGYNATVSGNLPIIIDKTNL